MFRYAAVAILALGAIACSNKVSQDQFTKYYDDGRAKPIIAIAPIIDTTSFDSSWSLSEEFSSTLFSKLLGKGTLFLNNENEKFLTTAENPFSNDLAWVKREFSPNEFVIFLEIVEHNLVPVDRTQMVTSPETSSHLNVAIRIRIVDIRGNTPKIVLQELVRESQYFSRVLIPFDYNKFHWGTDEYIASPMGEAHANIVKQLVERINDYVLLAKSRG